MLLLQQADLSSLLLLHFAMVNFCRLVTCWGVGPHPVWAPFELQNKPSSFFVSRCRRWQNQ